MSDKNKRRSFLKTVTGLTVGASVLPSGILTANSGVADGVNESTSTNASGVGRYNAVYTEHRLNRLAFPIGGIGAGMFCLEGSGAISHMSIRNKPDIFNEPSVFAAIRVKGMANGVKVLEGPVPDWKMFGNRGTGNGAAGTTYGLPRFESASFKTHFPFGDITLRDRDLPLEAKISGWSPFVPTEPDDSSLPVGAIEYSFRNTSLKTIDAVFSFNAKNFMAANEGIPNSIRATKNGFTLLQDGTADRPFLEGSFSAFADDPATVVDHCWFRGGWWDPLTMAWNNVRDGKINAIAPVEKDAPGASLYIPFKLSAGATKTIRLMFAWYVPESDIRIGDVVIDEKKNCDPETGCCGSPADLGVSVAATSNAPNFKPWYSSKFRNIEEVIAFWKSNYGDLKRKSTLFSKSFYSSSLPDEVLEAVAANLTIIKSPTVLRQYDGRLWSWEGCGDDGGCCHGSCTHVWNYAQAIPHLFPSLERTLRNTEFCENQNLEGHQGFRTNMPISPLKHDFHAAADGQLGGIMKVYRDWRISGDSQWMSKIFPMVLKSMDYCIKTWDTRQRGVVEEPHHNTYDIEFWGPDGMCTSFYLGALTAIIAMGTHLKNNVTVYETILEKGRKFMETELFNGEYFFQQVEFKTLNAPDPATAKSFGGEYSAEARRIMENEGPKYQYGTGCLSDGVLGAWIASMCGLPHFLDKSKLRSHLLSIHKYNLKHTLADHANPQRPAYALGSEGGLLLCTWPKGGKPSLPFVYSDEVWTGIEYQVASHLMETGKIGEALEIVRYCRDRYDGKSRNPFNEYECGHWYARAMSSYGMLQSLTGVRYDAVDKTLYVNSRIGDFTSFLSTAAGFGTVKSQKGKVTVDVAYGKIDVLKIVSPSKMSENI